MYLDVNTNVVGASGTIQYMSNIGKRLIEARTRAGLSQEDLAAKSGVSQGTIGHLESGRNKSSTLLPKIASALGVTVEWLTGTAKQGVEAASIYQMGAAGLADRIKSVLDEADGNISKVAAAAGTTEETVAGWLSGSSRAISIDHAVALQESLGINSVWLMLGKGSRTTSVRYNDPWDPITNLQWKGVPVLGMAQLGDNGFWSEIEYPVGQGDGFVDVPTKDKDAYALRCIGDSMRPRIKNREFVVVEPNHAIEPGDEVLVKAKDGRVMVKEFLYQRAGRTHLISVNEAHGTIALKDEDIERMHYVGWIAKPSAWRPD
jgi:phage repressor protein C with HTH and peptisase S24 domain